MSLKEPILTKRIPTAPWADPKTRSTISWEQSIATGGYKALEKALDMLPTDVINVVKDAVIRGRGGAGFPAGLKWSFLAPIDGGRRYLAVNCDEAEPGTFKDRLLVDFDPHLVLEGIAIACWACQLDTAYFFIRGEYHHQARVMERAIQEAYAGGIFGKQGLMRGKQKFAVDCFLHRSAGAYICGEETGLLEAIEGKRGWPRIKPPFPAVKGLFGRPTIVNNVETLAAAVPVLEHGAAWWKGIGVESKFPGAMPSYGSKLMGVSGHVNKPGVYEMPLGISLRTLVQKSFKFLLDLVGRFVFLTGKISGTQSSSCKWSSSAKNSFHFNFLSNFLKSTKTSVMLRFVGVTQKFRPRFSTFCIGSVNSRPE